MIGFEPTQFSGSLNTAAAAVALPLSYIPMFWWTMLESNQLRVLLLQPLCRLHNRPCFERNRSSPLYTPPYPRRALSTTLLCCRGPSLWSHLITLPTNETAVKFLSHTGTDQAILLPTVIYLFIIRQIYFPCRFWLGSIVMQCIARRCVLRSTIWWGRRDSNPETDRLWADCSDQLRYTPISSSTLYHIQFYLSMIL